MARCKGIKKNRHRCRITRDLNFEGYCKYHEKQSKSSKDKYTKYMNSKEWQTKRETVLSILGKTCKLCGRSGVSVHHNTYERLYREDLLKDLTVLCSGCHKKYHKKGK